MEEKKKRLPCVKGFASVRSTLAGVAERGSETAQRLEGCKKTIPQSACADSSIYTREPENSPITEVSFAYFSFQRKVRCLLFFSKKVRSKKSTGKEGIKGGVAFFAVDKIAFPV